MATSARAGGLRFAEGAMAPQLEVALFLHSFALQTRHYPVIFTPPRDIPSSATGV
jgi:hypothetical protein